MRPRRKDRNLPACMYLRHGAYWFVKGGKWRRLSDSLPESLEIYVKLISPGVGMPALIHRAHEHIIRNVKPNTEKQYTQARDKLSEILAEFSPEQVKPRDVAAIKAHYADRPNMGNRIISYLRMVFALAVEWQEVDSNPCVGISRHQEKKRSRYINDAEFKAIRQHATENLRAILDILYLTGQRIGDVLAIRLSDVTEEGIYFQQQKTGQRLLISMTPDLQEAVSRAKSLPRPVRGMTLFCTMRGGRQYSYRTVRDMFNRATRSAGIEDVTPHDIRAKSLTDAKRQGKNAVALGGHADPRMTERYIRQRETTTAEPPSFGQLLDILDKSKSK